MTTTAKKVLSVFLAFVLVFTLSPTVAFGGNEGESENARDDAGELLVNDKLVSEDIGESKIDSQDDEDDDPVATTKDPGAVTQTTMTSASEPNAGMTAQAERYYLTEKSYLDYESYGDGYAITSMHIEDKNVELVIPSSINEKPVVALGTPTTPFPSGGGYKTGTIKSFTIPDSVKYMSPYKFNYNVEEKIEFTGDSPLTELYEEAFKNFPGTTIALPQALTKISPRMFQIHSDTGRLTITLPENVTEIQSQGFYGAGALNGITLNDKLTTIGIEAFASEGEGSYEKSCIPKFTTISIPASVSRIDGKAFAKNIYLTSVTFAQPSTSLQIGDYAFYGTSLQSLVIPDGVTSIGKKAFTGRNGQARIDDTNPYQGGDYTLTNVTLGNSLTTLGSEAFAYQPITSITLPNSLTSLGYSELALDNDGNLTGSLGAFAGCAQLTSIAWPTDGNLTTVGGFNDCTSLTAEAVNNLPSTVTTIDDYAFYNCTGMDNVQIPSSVTTIGKGAFSKGSKANSTGKVFTLTNSSVTINWTEGDPTTGPWPLGCGYIINYPLSAGSDSSIEQYRKAVEKYEEDNNVSADKRTKFSVSAGEYKKVTGTVPEGASVALTIGSEETQPELDGNHSFSTWVESGKYVSATISLDGYADYLIAPGPSDADNIRKVPSALTRDWTFTVNVSDMTPRSQLGTLQVTTTGDYNQNCNVAVFEHSTGRLVSQGNVLRIRAYIVEDIPAETYDVVGWQENDYFKRVSSLSDFGLMGFGTTDYAKTTVTIEPREVKEITLEIPQLDTSKISGILATGEVYVPSLYTPPSVPFVAIMKYDMTTGQSVDSV